uniref:Uncharacterized protein n=1 Tax=Caenorhabditis japonica TaxID=281687 RepID=A0A8R1HV50_CAEJA
MNSVIYFNDYYNRRASSGTIDDCMQPTFSAKPEKSHSADELHDRDKHPSDEFLEFAKTANFRSRRDAIFEPLGTASKTHLVISSGATHVTTLSDATNEFGRVTMSSSIGNPKKRKTIGNEITGECYKKLKSAA